MATRDVGRRRSPGTAASAQVSTSTEALMLAAIERSEDLSKTGRFLVTYKEDAMNEGMKHLQSQRGLSIANARDFKDQAVAFEAATDADAVVFPEIGVALLSGAAATSRAMTAEALIAEDSPVHSIDPEYFMFANAINASDYMKGVLHTAQMIYADLGEKEAAEEFEVTPAVLERLGASLRAKCRPAHAMVTGLR